MLWLIVLLGRFCRVSRRLSSIGPRSTSRRRRCFSGCWGRLTFRLPCWISSGAWLNLGRRADLSFLSFRSDPRTVNGGAPLACPCMVGPRWCHRQTDREGGGLSALHLSPSRLSRFPPPFRAARRVSPVWGDCARVGVAPGGQEHAVMLRSARFLTGRARHAHNAPPCEVPSWSSPTRPLRNLMGESVTPILAVFHAYKLSCYRNLL